MENVSSKAAVQPAGRSRAEGLVREAVVKGADRSTVTRVLTDAAMSVIEDKGLYDSPLLGVLEVLRDWCDAKVAAIDPRLALDDCAARCWGEEAFAVSILVRLPQAISPFEDTAAAAVRALVGISSRKRVADLVSSLS